MDEMLIIDCIEKVRAWGLEQDPELSLRLQRLRSSDYRKYSTLFFREQLVAVALGIDYSLPVGRRRIQQELQRLEGVLQSAVPGSHGLPSTLQEPSLREHAAAPDLLTSYRALATTNGSSLDLPSIFGKEAGVSGVVRRLSKRLPVLRGQKLYEFLIACGYPAALPSKEAVRFCRRHGLLADNASQGSTPATHRSMMAALETMARLTGASLAEVDYLIRLFSGGARNPRISPVCTRLPVCASCPIASTCNYLQYAPPKVEEASSRPIKSWIPAERPRERLLAGEKLTGAELLAVLLGSGTRKQSAVELGRQLLEKFGSLNGLAEAAVSDIALVKGIGPAKAAKISAAMELGRRATAAEHDVRDGLRIVTSSRDIFETYRARYRHATQEEFLLLALNTKNRITRELTVSVGTLNASIVHPRDVFNHALRAAAAGVIFVHNHPSGDPTPSKEDRTLTTRLVDAGKLLGIRVLDHIIVGATRFYSFADEGELG